MYTTVITCYKKFSKLCNLSCAVRTSHLGGMSYHVTETIKYGAWTSYVYVDSCVAF